MIFLQNNRLTQRLNSDILYLIDIINIKHPEIKIFLSELPIIDPHQMNKKVSISELKSYRETLAHFVKNLTV